MKFRFISSSILTQALINYFNDSSDISVISSLSI